MKYTGFHRALEIDLKAHRSSWQIHLCRELEMDFIEKLRADYRERGLEPPTYTACMIKTIARAIDELKPKYPEINSFLKNIFGIKSIFAFDGISAGCSSAMDGEEAVVVGVIQEPQKLELTEISKRLATIAGPDSIFMKDARRYYRAPKLLQIFFHWLSKNLWKARYERRGTFCLNPVGKFGADIHLTLPQTSSLQFGMGVIRDRVVAREGKPVVAKTLFLTLSFDRRLMNGRPPSLLMDRIRQIIESEIR